MCVSQVLCEFKDIRSGLDAKQARKGNTRSPVEQCFDYLHSSWQARDRDSLVEPFFALVTDMNEFRLYVRRLGRSQFQRFVLSDLASATEPTLLADTPAAAFRRFVFWKLFQPEMLLAERGAALLDRLLREQRLSVNRWLNLFARMEKIVSRVSRMGNAAFGK
jgi:hypothetical protein